MLKKIVFSLFLSLSLEASVSRIAERSLNIAAVNPIHLSFGRVALIDLPCEVRKISLGLSESYKVELDQKTKKEITISMKGEVKHPSNMLVRCDQYLLVFDLIPSKKNHQASLKVNGLYENRKTTGARKLVIER